ncbi:MAG: 50S ribosomal protein L33 [Candidatus Moranbacteria bacterium]|jgi:large subunit ribosomal protein L33|nr:50S ribosomal protein L33 [Candidatus Moranbacteria bacterium]
MATKLKERMVKFRCSLCDRITHYSKRNKKKLKEKLELSKYCRFCKKNTLHKEVK